MTIGIGSRLGPYEIVAPIGAGGMGEVYRARDTRLDRTVALKVLPAHLADDEERKARFEKEARAISALSHPHICTLFDVGTEKGTPFLVMEYLEGESLSDRIAKGPLPLDQVLRYGAQIADALAAAHGAGVVHRDLKPGNVMLTKTGAKLLDFGLAKAAGVDGMSASSELETFARGLTTPGTVLGTFQYMAPEQLEGGEADPRTDMFALGVVLYEMAAGRRAFEGKSRASLIAAILSGQPRPLGELQPLTPPAFEHVLSRCLAKEPDERWQSARDVAQELRWIAQAGSQAGARAAAPTARGINRERLAWTAGLVVAVAATFTVARTFLREEPRQYRFSIPTVGDGFREAGGFALSPDAMAVAFNARDDAGNLHVWLRRFDEASARRLEGSQGLSLGRFSPDGDSLILGVGRRKLVRLSITAGAPQVIAELDKSVIGLYPRILADGTTVFAGPDGRIYKAVPGESAPVALTTLDAARFELRHQHPAILPGEKHFLFTAYRRDPNSGRIVLDLFVASLDGRSVRRLGETTSRVDYADGRLFFVSEGTLMAQPFDLRGLRITGVPQPVVDGVDYYRQTGGAAYQAGANGTIIYQPFRGAARMGWYDLLGRPLDDRGLVGDVASIRIAPGGDSVYLDVRGTRDGARHLWRRGLARDTAEPISFDWAHEYSPVLSPDGSQLFYGSDRGEFADVYVKPADGTQPGRPLVSEASVQEDPSDVSPDGRYLLYVTDRPETKTDLWVKPLSGGGGAFPFVVSPEDDQLGRFSPDGRTIAYMSLVSGIREVYVKPFPGPGPARQVSVHGGTRPRWSPDGKVLYFQSGRTAIMAADAVPSAEPRLLFDAGANIRDFDVGRDGKRLLLVLSSDEQLSPPLNVIVGWRPRSR